MQNTLAPIIVFAYNRPSHLQKTLTWLCQNELADQSVLYVMCDGPKPNATEEQLAKVYAARKVAKDYATIPNFKEVHIVEHAENSGLGTSIISGVTEIINKQPILNVELMQKYNEYNERKNRWISL